MMLNNSDNQYIVDLNKLMSYSEIHLAALVIPNLFCNFGIDERELIIRVQNVDYTIYLDDFVSSSTFLAYCNS